MRDARRDSSGGLARHRRHQLRFAGNRYLELDVDAIGERARYASAVARDALGRAAAAAGAIAAMSARARIHRRDQLEARRKLDLPRGARDGYPSAFDRLAQ